MISYENGVLVGVLFGNGVKGNQKEWSKSEGDNIYKKDCGSLSIPLP